MITPATFRTDFPVFAKLSDYPNSAIAYWIAVGELMLPIGRWGAGAMVAVAPSSKIRDVGLELFVAHNIILERQAAQAAASGATPGQVRGPVSSKSVGPGSVSYDTAAAMAPDAGHWNMTVYGLRFIRLARFVGMGPIQVGIGANPVGVGSGGAWPGPMYWPYPWSG